MQQEISPGERVPSLTDISSNLNVSVSKLREQLEVARCLGVVSVRPRAGIHRQEYSFMPAVRLGLFLGMADDIVMFDAYKDLRCRIEMAYWYEAVALLSEANKTRLLELVDLAWQKLRGTPIRIPHQEHREFHLTIFANLDNLFVRGLLEAYWEAYEAVELHTFTDYEYLNQVWTYHQRIAEAIVAGDIEASLQAFDEHTRLLKNFAERGADSDETLTRE